VEVEVEVGLKVYFKNQNPTRINQLKGSPPMRFSPEPLPSGRRWAGFLAILNS